MTETGAAPPDPQTLRRRAARRRKRVLQTITAVGAGHTGGDLSCLDLLTVLYDGILRVSPETADDPDRDRFVMSKGHSVEALYVVLADRGFFPVAELATVGRYRSPFVGHPTRHVPGVEQNTGALGHGLAFGVGTALGARLAGRSFRTFVLVGDGELAEGSNWEAALAAAHHRLDGLVMIVDRNGLQITGPTEDVCGLEPLAGKLRAFGWAVREVDGHDPAALLEVLGSVPFEPGRPSAVVARTVKGRGVSFIEGTASWHHRVPKSDELARAIAELEGEERRLGGEPEPAVVVPLPPRAQGPAAQGLAMGRANQDVFSETVLELARVDPSVVVVTSDSRGSGKMSAFAQALPQQLVEVGIAEQMLVGAAAGLASAGRKPFAVSPACFLTARSLEQIKNDVAYSAQPVRLVGISAGVSYGALGSTHHSTHDLAVLRAIPGVTLIVPADNHEARAAARAAHASAGPVYVRIGKRPVPDLPGPAFELGRARVVRDGDDLAFVATGETVWIAWAAAERLAREGRQCRVLSLHTLRPFDAEAVRAAARTRGIVTVEEHSACGGLGEACASVLAQAGLTVPLRIVALPDEETVAGGQAEILAHYGMTPEALAETARALLRDEKIAAEARP
ncbi:MAG: transketolase C-terminal domain-containing protein [Vicinamibacteria bacterium]